MKIFDSSPILTVTEITRSIKNNLENKFRFVRVCGEISNLSTPYSGHSYFVLKDDSAQIRGVLFKQQKRFIDLNLKNGQQLICFGRITVYDPRGEYQLVVDSVQLKGEGKLQVAFEKLKNKLASRGYFADESKKKLPNYPKKIAIISSPTGAALQDFLKIDSIRNSLVSIQIIPVRVQGDRAAREIVGAIELADSLEEFDIIVLCRGGGSLEDLWAFNEESVAQAIYKSRTPIVTGIGHEVDFTIADFCADFRCPTPTGAAEKIIPDTKDTLRVIKALRVNLTRLMNHKCILLENRLKHQTRYLQNFSRQIESETFRLQMSRSYIIGAISNNLRKKVADLGHIVTRLHAQAPIHQITLQTARVHFLEKQLKEKMFNLLLQKKAALSGEAKLLNSVSPLATLGRGYSITKRFSAVSKSYEVLLSVDNVEVGEQVNVLLHQGELECEVKKKLNNS